MFDFVKENKPNKSYQELLLLYGDSLTKNIEEQIYELYYNFLTDEDTILIDKNFNTSHKEKDNLVNLSSRGRYLCDVLNTYLVEDVNMSNNNKKSHISDDSSACKHRKLEKCPRCDGRLDIYKTVDVNGNCLSKNSYICTNCDFIK